MIVDESAWLGFLYAGLGAITDAYRMRAVNHLYQTYIVGRARHSAIAECAGAALPLRFLHRRGFTGRQREALSRNFGMPEITRCLGLSTQKGWLSRKAGFQLVTGCKPRAGDSKFSISVLYNNGVRAASQSQRRRLGGLSGRALPVRQRVHGPTQLVSFHS